MSRKKRALQRQSVLTVRITNHVDDGFLQWLNRVHEQGLLQRLAIEGLYLQYSQELPIPGAWVPLPTKEAMILPKETLQSLLTSEADHAKPRSTDIPEVETISKGEPQVDRAIPPATTNHSEGEVNDSPTTEKNPLDDLLLGNLNQFLNQS